MNIRRVMERLRSQEGAFSEEKYLQETDPQQRLDMAREYYQTAHNAWIAVYDRAVGVLGDLPDRARVAFDTKLQDVSARQHEVASGYEPEDRAKKTEVYAEPVKALLDLRDVALFLSVLGESLSAEAKSGMLETGWNMFLDQFGLPDDISPVTREALDWLKRKIISREVMMLSLADAKSPQEEAQIRQLLTSLSAPFLLSPMPGSTKQQLIILPDFILPNQVGEDFISTLAHEFGHAVYNQTQVDQAEPTTAEELIFSEFFAFLEEWRSFASMTRDEIAQLTSNDRRDGFIIAEYLRNTELATTLPNMQTETKVDFTAALNALFRAYQHGLFIVHHTDISHELERLQQLSEPKLTDAEIKARLSHLKIVTASVLPTETPEWVLRRKG